jgi:glycosyltransferase involved in cell wall biosynthesis
MNDWDPLVGIVGRIFPIKNHRLFLEAAARVAAQVDGARFLVVGDGVLRPAIEEHGRTLGIAHRVVFTGWRRDLPSIYPDLDVLVVSSNNEGTPVSAIEAMAAGCPVVATRVGGLIVRLLRDRQMARRLGEAARATVAGRFAVERLCRDVEDLYVALLARKGIVVPGRALVPAGGR